MSQVPHIYVDADACPVKAETVKVLTSVGRAATAATVDPKLYPLLVEALRTATVPGAV